MENRFLDQPILNSPYGYPAKHWEFDDEGQPTQQIIENRRSAEFTTPIPKSRRRRADRRQQEFVIDEGKGLTAARVLPVLGGGTDAGCRPELGQAEVVRWNW